MALGKGKVATGIAVFYFTLLVLKYYFEMLSQGPPHWILAALVYWSVVAIVSVALWYVFRLVERFFLRPKPPTS